MGLIKAEEGKSPRRPSPKQIKQEFKVTVHKFKLPSRKGGALRAMARVPTSVVGFDQIIGKGYPPGSILNIVGYPKAGKTTFTLHEAMMASKAGKEALVMYNESPMWYYMQGVDEHRADLGLTEGDLDKLSFMDAHGKFLKSAQFAHVRERAILWVVNPIRRWLQEGHKPRFIVIDSLTKFYRTYPAQSFAFVSEAVFGLKEAFKEFGVRPVVLVVHQKASQGSGSKTDDERGFGGWGNIHEMDGSIVLKMMEIGYWESKNMGFPIGTTQRFIKANFRNIRVPELDYHFVQRKKTPRRLEVREPLYDLVQKHKEAGWQGGPER